MHGCLRFRHPRARSKHRTHQLLHRAGAVYRQPSRVEDDRLRPPDGVGRRTARRCSGRSRWTRWPRRVRWWTRRPGRRSGTRRSRRPERREYRSPLQSRTRRTGPEPLQLRGSRCASGNAEVKAIWAVHTACGRPVYQQLSGPAAAGLHVVQLLTRLGETGPLPKKAATPRYATTTVLACMNSRIPADESSRP